MSDDRKERRIERKDFLRPQHDDGLGARTKYESTKALFDAILEETKDG